MIQSKPFSCPKCRAAICLLSLSLSFALAIGGCGRHSPGQSQGHDHEEVHVGHEIPAHKPRDLPDAVRRLRELNRQIGLEIDGEEAGAPRDGKSLEMARDIANWLPEIAADSDMPEAPWDVVNTRSGVILAAYGAIPAAPATGAHPDDARAALKGAGVAIASLEELLSASDPRWFSKAKTIAETPKAGDGTARPTD